MNHCVRKENCLAVTNRVSNEDCFVTAKKIVPTALTKILATTITIPTARHHVTRPCAFYQTVSVPKTVPAYPTICQPKKCPR